MPCHAMGVATVCTTARGVCLVLALFGLACALEPLLFWHDIIGVGAVNDAVGIGACSSV